MRRPICPFCLDGVPDEFMPNNKRNMIANTYVTRIWMHNLRLISEDINIPVHTSCLAIVKASIPDIDSPTQTDPTTFKVPVIKPDGTTIVLTNLKKVITSMERTTKIDVTNGR